jgi:hypothetical protein
MLTAITTILVVGFVLIAAFGHVLLFTAIVFGRHDAAEADQSAEAVRSKLMRFAA